MILFGIMSHLFKILDHFSKTTVIIKNMEVSLAGCPTHAFLFFSAAADSTDLVNKK